jgi:hypothetical protein
MWITLRQLGNWESFTSISPKKHLSHTRAYCEGNASEATRRHLRAASTLPFIDSNRYSALLRVRVGHGKTREAAMAPS